MPVSIVRGGVWKAVPKLWVVVGGAWKQVSNGWVVVGGVWKKFYSGISGQLLGCSSTRVVAGGASAVALIQVDTDGNVYRYNSAGVLVFHHQWLLSGVPSDFEVGYISLDAGTTPTFGPALGVFTNLATSVAWRNTQAGGGFATKSSTFNVHLRTSATHAVLASASFALTAQVEP